MAPTQLKGFAKRLCMNKEMSVCTVIGIMPAERKGNPAYLATAHQLEATRLNRRYIIERKKKTSFVIKKNPTKYCTS